MPEYCVTGGTGFIAAYLIKALLLKGHIVRTTVRDPDNAEKVGFLWELEGAKERLKILKADLLVEGSFDDAIEGVDGVFHTASPVLVPYDDNIQKTLIDPCVNGTLNVLNSCKKSSTLKRLVLTSSCSSIRYREDAQQISPLNESHWSDLQYCQKYNLWYAYAKTKAEKEAWRVAEECGIDLVVMNPSFVVGPLLAPQPTSTLQIILGMVKGMIGEYANRRLGFVHIEDVVGAHILVMEEQKASGRYICSNSVRHMSQINDLLRTKYPSYPHENKCDNQQGEDILTMDGGQRRMSIDNEKLPISPKTLGVHDPSLNQGGQINSPIFAANRDPIQNGSAEAVICNSKKLEDAMQEFGLKIKHHEDNVKYLKAVKNELDDSILDIRVALGTTKSASETGSENKESSNGQNEEETIEQILSFDKSAAAICVQLQKRSGAQITQIPFMKDIIGIVALLGKVDDDNLSRSLSDYLGLETMLGVVCKTRDGVKALETYDREGRINKSSGFHGLGASIGRPLNGGYLVICLEDLRPYAGKFIADDPQRRLDIKKPRYLNEETPPGFLGFAVNMINIDTANLYCVTSTGYGLRETLFYRLFSRLQVYKTRADMLQALPLIAHGAISLDGGIIKSSGIFSQGEREVKIKFPMSSGRPNVPENYYESEIRLKELQWKRARFVDDLQREQTLLDHAKFNFEIKKQDFVKFLARSSSYASAPQFPAGGERSTPIS